MPRVVEKCITSCLSELQRQDSGNTSRYWHCQRSITKE